MERGGDGVGTCSDHGEELEIQSIDYDLVTGIGSQEINAGPWPWSRLGTGLSETIDMLTKGDHLKAQENVELLLEVEVTESLCSAMQSQDEDMKNNDSLVEVTIIKPRYSGLNIDSSPQVSVKTLRKKDLGYLKGSIDKKKEESKKDLEKKMLELQRKINSASPGEINRVSNVELDRFAMLNDGPYFTHNVRERVVKSAPNTIAQQEYRKGQAHRNKKQTAEYCQKDYGMLDETDVVVELVDANPNPGLWQGHMVEQIQMNCAEVMRVAARNDPHFVRICDENGKPTQSTEIRKVWDSLRELETHLSKINRCRHKPPYNSPDAVGTRSSYKLDEVRSDTTYTQGKDDDEGFVRRNDPAFPQSEKQEHIAVIREESAAMLEELFTNDTVSGAYIPEAVNWIPTDNYSQTSFGGQDQARIFHDILTRQNANEFVTVPTSKLTPGQKIGPAPSIREENARFLQDFIANYKGSQKVLIAYNFDSDTPIITQLKYDKELNDAFTQTDRKNRDPNSSGSPSTSSKLDTGLDAIDYKVKHAYSEESVLDHSLQQRYAYGVKKDMSTDRGINSTMYECNADTYSTLATDYRTDQSVEYDRKETEAHDFGRFMANNDPDMMTPLQGEEKSPQYYMSSREVLMGLEHPHSQFRNAVNDGRESPRGTQASEDSLGSCGQMYRKQPAYEREQLSSNGTHGRQVNRKQSEELPYSNPSSSSQIYSRESPMIAESNTASYDRTQSIASSGIRVSNTNSFTQINSRQITEQPFISCGQNTSVPSYSNISSFTKSYEKHSEQNQAIYNVWHHSTDVSPFTDQSMTSRQSIPESNFQNDKRRPDAFTPFTENAYTQPVNRLTVDESAKYFHSSSTHVQARDPKSFGKTAERRPSQYSANKQAIEFQPESRVQSRLILNTHTSSQSNAEETGGSLDDNTKGIPADKWNEWKNRATSFSNTRGESRQTDASDEKSNDMDSLSLNTRNNSLEGYNARCESSAASYATDQTNSNGSSSDDSLTENISDSCSQTTERTADMLTSQVVNESSHFETGGRADLDNNMQTGADFRNNFREPDNHQSFLFVGGDTDHREGGRTGRGDAVPVLLCNHKTSCDCCYRHRDRTTPGRRRAKYGIFQQRSKSEVRSGFGETVLQRNPWAQQILAPENMQQRPLFHEMRTNDQCVAAYPCFQNQGRNFPGIHSDMDRRTDMPEPCQESSNPQPLLQVDATNDECRRSYHRSSENNISEEKMSDGNMFQQESCEISYDIYPTSPEESSEEVTQASGRNFSGRRLSNNSLTSAEYNVKGNRSTSNGQSRQNHGKVETQDSLINENMFHPKRCEELPNISSRLCESPLSGHMSQCTTAPTSQKPQKNFWNNTATKQVYRMSHDVTFRPHIKLNSAVDNSAMRNIRCGFPCNQTREMERNTGKRDGNCHVTDSKQSTCTNKKSTDPNSKPLTGVFCMDIIPDKSLLTKLVEVKPTTRERIDPSHDSIKIRTSSFNPASADSLSRKKIKNGDYQCKFLGYENIFSFGTFPVDNKKSEVPLRSDNSVHLTYVNPTAEYWIASSSDMNLGMENQLETDSRRSSKTKGTNIDNSRAKREQRSCRRLLAFTGGKNSFPETTNVDQPSSRRHSKKSLDVLTLRTCPKGRKPLKCDSERQVELCITIQDLEKLCGKQRRRCNGSKILMKKTSSPRKRKLDNTLGSCPSTSSRKKFGENGGRVYLQARAPRAMYHRVRGSTDISVKGSGGRL